MWMIDLLVHCFNSGLIHSVIVGKILNRNFRDCDCLKTSLGTYNLIVKRMRRRWNMMKTKKA